MSKTNSFIQLDIGGGPDFLPENPGEEEIYQSNLERVRAALLAAEHPDRTYIVFDPVLDQTVAKKVEEKLPNVSFVEGQVDAQHSLPFETASMSAVEVNHIFMPLILKPMAIREAELKAQRRSFQSEHFISAEQVEAKMQPLIASFSQFVATEPNRLMKEGTPEDFGDYIAIIREAARVLKPGGSLVIAEKQNRINAIMRVLSQLGDNGAVSVLKEVGLEFVSLEENNDENASGFSRAAKAWHDKAKVDGIADERAHLKPLVLTLKKLG